MKISKSSCIKYLRKRFQDRHECKITALKETKTNVIYKNRIYIVPYFKTVNTHLLLLASSYSSSSLHTKNIFSLTEDGSPPSSTAPSSLIRTPSPSQSAAASTPSRPPRSSSPPSRPPPTSSIRTPPPSRSAAASTPPRPPRTSSPGRYPPPSPRTIHPRILRVHDEDGRHGRALPSHGIWLAAPRDPELPLLEKNKPGNSS